MHLPSPWRVFARGMKGGRYRVGGVESQKQRWGRGLGQMAGCITGSFWIVLDRAVRDWRLGVGDWREALVAKELARFWAIERALVL